MLWLATGGEGARVQALYSLYSAIAFKSASTVTLHVYTDEPGTYAPVGKLVEIHQLTADRMRELSGAAQLPYRVKLALLLEALRGDLNWPVMFVDADTFFFREFSPLLDQIDAQNAVMHRREWHVASGATGQIRRFRRNMQRVYYRGASVDLNAYMWNSGMVGLHPTCAGILQEALTFIDEVWKQYPKPFVEQFAVSSFLQKANISLHPADDYVFHYWFQKAAYQKEIEQRLQRWRNIPVEAVLEAIRSDKIVLPPPSRKLHWWEKIRQRVSGRAIPDVRGLPK